MIQILKPFKFAFGIIFFILGLFFLLINFSIIQDLSFISYLNGFWAIGLILAGILIMLKQKIIGIIILTISIILGCLILCAPSDYSNEIIIEHESLLINESFETLNYDVEFGAGKLYIKSFENEKIEVDVISTSSINQELILKYDDIDEKEAEIEIYQNHKDGFEIISEMFNNEAINQLNISINNNTNVQELELEFGAAEAVVDLRNLNIKELDLGFGASDVTIYFENDIEASINCGASDIKLLFPKNKNIVIDSQGGLIDINLDNFKKINNKYYNNYEAENQDIEIKIEAGVSSISGRYYNEK